MARAGQETSKWPADLVADLSDRIALAKHGGLTEQRGAAWDDEAARRSKEVDSGRESPVPEKEVSARIRMIAGR